MSNPIAPDFMYGIHAVVDSQIRERIPACLGYNYNQYTGIDPHGMFKERYPEFDIPEFDALRCHDAAYFELTPMQGFSLPVWAIAVFQTKEHSVNVWFGNNVFDRSDGTPGLFYDRIWLRYHAEIYYRGTPTALHFIQMFGTKIANDTVGYHLSGEEPEYVEPAIAAEEFLRVTQPLPAPPVDG